MFKKYPLEFVVDSSPKPMRYLLSDTSFAVRSSSPRDDRGLDVQFQLEDGQILVCRGKPSEDIASSPATEVLPVYRCGDKGPLAVPTGDVFLRFDEFTSLQERAADIKQAGFTIKRVLSYAPHAGWVAPNSGNADDALRDFGKLSQLDGVQSVEPQMLMRASRR